MGESAVDRYSFCEHAQHPIATWTDIIMKVYAKQQSHLKWNHDVLETFKFIFYMALLQLTLAGPRSFLM